MRWTFRTRRGAGETRKPGLGGKIALTIFFLFFLGMGLLFVGLLTKNTIDDVDTYTWTTTEAEVLESSIVERGGDDDHAYVLRTLYRYEVGGVTYRSSVVSPGYAGDGDYLEAQRSLDRYPAGARVTCWVDPDDPSRATLQRNSLWTSLFVFVPLIFVAVGGGGIFMVWRSGTKSISEAAPRSISATARKGRRKVVRPVAFGLCLAVGTIATWFLLVKPAARLLDARTWPELPCAVISSEVRSHDSDDGTTYSVDILYAYEFEGRPYRSNRYDFLGGSSSGYEGKREIVNRHPPGTRTVCYADPKDPAYAVLEREFRAKYLLGLIPVVFVLVGAAGLAQSIRAGGSHGPGTRSGAPREESRGEVILTPQTTPVTKLVGAIFLAVFWNGIISIFLSQVIAGWRHGSAPWFDTLFLTPFLLVGLFLVGLVFYQLLAMANPRPRLRLQAGRIQPGADVHLAWTLSGRVHRLGRLSVYLEGREEATYTRGTDRTTDRETFCTMIIADAETVPEFARGSARFSIPPDAMHSFAAPHNKVVWSLKVRGEIPRWPDVDEEFPLEVLPGESTGAIARESGTRQGQETG
jgi:hypothetical protein